MKLKNNPQNPKQQIHNSNNTVHVQKGQEEAPIDAQAGITS